MNNDNLNLETEVTKEGISFSEILFLIKRNIIMIIIITIVFTGIGFVYGKFFCKPTYSASTTAVVQVENNSISEYNAFVYSQYLVNSMAEFIVSDSVTKEVAKALINEKYDIEVYRDLEDNITGYYSHNEKKEISVREYDSLVLAKKNVIQSGAKISTSTESLLIKITYSCAEEDENTKNEVIKIVDLLVEKTKEVAAQQKEVISYRQVKREESINAIIYAHKQVNGLEEIINNDGTKSYKLSDGRIVNSTHFEQEAAILRQNYGIYYDGKAVVMSISTSKDVVLLDEEVAFYCLSYLTDYVKNDPLEVYGSDYMYPTFANKLVEMNDVVYASVSTKTLLVTVIAFILGIIVSCGIILIKYILDDTFTSKDEIEKLTGANVLTFIDKFDTKEIK